MLDHNYCSATLLVFWFEFEPHAGKRIENRMTCFMSPLEMIIESNNVLLGCQILLIHYCVSIALFSHMLCDTVFYSAMDTVSHTPSAAWWSLSCSPLKLYITSIRANEAMNGRMKKKPKEEGKKGREKTVLLRLKIQMQAAPPKPKAKSRPSPRQKRQSTSQVGSSPIFLLTSNVLLLGCQRV